MFEDQFVAHDGIYLLNHSVGRPPVSAAAAMREDFFAPWEHGDAEVWPVWLAKIENFRSVLGSLLNGAAEDFCPQTNLSSALTKLVHSFPKRTGKQTLLLHEDSFPSMGFVLQCAEKSGFDISMIPAELDPGDINTWTDHLTDDVGVVLIIHVHSNTGVLTPVADIVADAKQRNITSIVDIAQSAGVVPIDLAEWNPDFVIGSCVKWLCGGPGAGFLWAHPDRVQICAPVDVGWFSHENPFEFDIRNFRYANGALRFWGGTPSVLPYVVAANSVALIQSIGVERIQQHNHELTQSILEALEPDCIVSPSEPERRGGTVVLNFGNKQETVVGRLHRAGIRFDTRSAGIRLSPHIYNNGFEVDLVRDCFD